MKNDMKDTKAICENAVRTYGIAHQVDKCIEEMSELGASLMQFRHGRLGIADVVTEIADVAIMAYQMSLIFGLTEVEAEIGRKLSRLEKRMGERRNG